MDRISRAKRSRLMSRIRSRWTGPEREFFAAHPGAVPHPRLPFSPDFLLGGRPVFLDSDFWHCVLPERRYSRMKKFWREKLFRNLVRDCARDAFWKIAARISKLQ